MLGKIFKGKIKLDSLPLILKTRLKVKASIKEPSWPLPPVKMLEGGLQLPTSTTAWALAQEAVPRY